MIPGCQTWKLRDGRFCGRDHIPCQQEDLKLSANSSELHIFQGPDMTGLVVQQRNPDFFFLELFLFALSYGVQVARPCVTNCTERRT